MTTDEQSAQIIHDERVRAERDGVTISQAHVPWDSFLAGYLSACVELERLVARELVLA